MTLPDSVEEITWQAFSGCENLREINLPKGLTYIEGQCFCNTALEKIEIPGSV